MMKIKKKKRSSYYFNFSALILLVEVFICYSTYITSRAMERGVEVTCGENEKVEIYFFLNKKGWINDVIY
jgi:hypothetical protein